MLYRLLATFAITVVVLASVNAFSLYVEEYNLTIEDVPSGARIHYRASAKTDATIDGTLQANITVNTGIHVSALYRPRNGITYPFNITIYIESNYEKRDDATLKAKMTMILAANNNTQKSTVRIIATIKQEDPKTLYVKISQVGREPSPIFLIASQLNVTMVNSILASYGLDGLIEFTEWKLVEDDVQTIYAKAIIKDSLLLAIVESHVRAERPYTGKLTIEIDYVSLKEGSYIKAKIDTRTSPNLILKAIDEICRGIGNLEAANSFKIACDIARYFNVTESTGKIIMNASEGTMDVEIVSPILYYKESREETRDRLEDILGLQRYMDTRTIPITETTKKKPQMTATSIMGKPKEGTGTNVNEYETSLQEENGADGTGIKRVALIVGALFIAIVSVILLLYKSREQ